MARADDNVNLGELIPQAQSGDRQSMDHLVHLVEGRVRAYIYRLTLDGDLTADLVQESLLQMVRSLQGLERPDAFWPWMYRTALGKVQHHFRHRERKARMAKASASIGGYPTAARSSDTLDGLTAMIQRELLEATCEAVGTLKLRQRSILVLRCFDQRSYEEIAAIMNCSETAAQVLFCRAKHSVRQRLSRRGLAGLWLAGLWSFARRTAPADAAPTAVQISAATTNVGLLPTIAGMIGTKLAAAAGIALAAMLLLAGGAIHSGGIHGPLRAAGEAGGGSEFEGFQYPYRLIAAYDPDKDGWRGIEANQVVAVPIDPNTWLLGAPPSEQSCVVLPVGHWIELGFAGQIVDGPGDDVSVVEWGRNGEQAHIFLTDGENRERLLGVLTVRDSGLQLATKAGFDIARVQLPFTPRAVRIVSVTGGGGTPGFDLHSVQARIRMSRPGDTGVGPAKD